MRPDSAEPVAAFDADELTDAVEIQRRSYRLLLWLRDAIPRGFIRMERVHEYTAQAAAAEAWIAEHFDNLPRDCRPAANAGPALQRFAAFFASYLSTSFCLVDEPARRRVGKCGCLCSICSYLVTAPHLRPKRLTPSNKRDARNLKAAFLRDLAGEVRASLTEAQAFEILGDARLSRHAALAAYGRLLMRRCRGESLGPVVLALWREFAWKPTGSPIPNFQLSVEQIVEAKDALSDLVRGGIPYAP